MRRACAMKLLAKISRVTVSSQRGGNVAAFGRASAEKPNAIAIVCAKPRGRVSYLAAKPAKRNSKYVSNLFSLIAFTYGARKYKREMK